MDLRDRAYTVMNVIKDEKFIDKSLAFYLDSDLADELTNLLLDVVDLREEDSEEDLIKILDNNDFVSVVVTRNKYGDYMYAEAIFNNGEQIYDTNDIFFIQDELIDIIDTNKLLDGKVIFMYDNEELYKTGIFIKDSINELLDDLNNLDGSISAKDVIKNYMLEVYSIGYKDGIRVCIEDLSNKLKEQF